MAKRVPRPMTKAQFIGELRRFSKEKRQELDLEEKDLDVSQLLRVGYFPFLKRSSWISGDSLFEAAKKQIESALWFIKDQKSTLLSDWRVYIFHPRTKFEFQPPLIQGTIFAKKDGSVSYGIEGILYRNTPGRRPLAKDLGPTISAMTIQDYQKMKSYGEFFSEFSLDVIFLRYFFENHQNALAALLSGAEIGSSE